jgi:hypothetical protein
MFMFDAQDQASGLRKLFGDNLPPPVHALSCPSRPAIVLPLAQITAHALVQQGFSLAWIDELDLGNRQDWPLPCPVRFDLSQALMGHVPLAASLLPLNPQLWYALARRLERVPHHVYPSLIQRMQEKGLKLDKILLCLDPSSQRMLSLYHEQVHHTVISGGSAEEVSVARDWIVQMQSRQPASSWSIVWVGVKGKGGRKSPTQTLVDDILQTTGQHVKVLGQVPASLAQGALSNAWAQPQTLRDLWLQHILQA